MRFWRTNASLCDTAGNLLFYTNGVFIANRNNDTMLNGSGLNPSFYTNSLAEVGLSAYQSHVFLPGPNESNKYYLFHLFADTIISTGGAPLKVYYSIIDMDGNNGLGEVVSKNNILLGDTIYGLNTLTVKHANGRDWWIINTKMASNTYCISLLTPLGVALHHLQSIGIPNLPTYTNCIFSPDGNKFINGSAYDRIEVMDFDRCTGLFDNPQFLPLNHSLDHLVAFSATGRFLYYVVQDTVFQYDFNSSNIAAKKTVVAIYDGFQTSTTIHTKFYDPILASNQKIYISSYGTEYFHVINYPDSAGIACNVVQRGIQLPYYISGIPHFPNYNLGRLPGSACDTVYSSISELEQENEVSVFPNPSLTGIFNFRFLDKSEQVKNLYVTDVTGRIIYVLPESSNELNLSNTADGIYFYRAKTNKEKIYNGKIIIQ